jgi:protein SCO1/2
VPKFAKVFWFFFSKKNTLSRRQTMRRALLAGAGVALALVIVFMVARTSGQQAPADIGIGGPFKLVDGAGKPVTERDFAGKFLLIYFGYTHCPDVCPTTLGSMAEGISKLPREAQERLVPVFITVDPERDTPPVVGAYAHAFGPSFVGLTGSASEIAKVEQEYRVYAQKHELKGGDYAMDHSSVIYIMGPDGKFLAALDDTTQPAAMAARLEQLGA